MTDETATDEATEVDPRVRMAELQEQAAADAAMSAHLRSRVVALRTDLNIAIEKISELAAELELRPPLKKPQDRKPRTPAKKAAQPRRSGKVSA